MLDFKKCDTGFLIFVNGEAIGRIYKDESRNYQFNHVAEFNFKMQGYNNTASAKNWKQVKVKAQKLYSDLMSVSQKYNKEIVKLG